MGYIFLNVFWLEHFLKGSERYSLLSSLRPLSDIRRNVPYENCIFKALKTRDWACTKVLFNESFVQFFLW